MGNTAQCCGGPLLLGVMKSEDDGNGAAWCGGNRGLLEDYTLGEVLGQGAFGVVYECKQNHGNADFDYAVKMVDKVETPVSEIRKEVDLLRKLSHPNVVKFHSVYYEKVFVCIVMDRYRGGDLIEGMQAYWKKFGKIPCTKIGHVAKQMVSSVAHLHSRSVVHRDVKGDNFLMDRPGLTDPTCRIIITDFGTATKVKPGERLNGSVGTKIYWPPEFYALDYSFKVDTWAIGVIMYGILDGRFPFKHKEDVLKKQVRLSPKVPPNAKEFIFSLLEKTESRRMDANEALLHPFIADVKMPTDSAQESSDKEDPNWAPRSVKEQVRAGLDQRRQELVERLEDAQAKKAKSTQDPFQRLQALYKGKFQCSDKRKRGSSDKGGRVLVLEWNTPEKARELKLIPEDSECTQEVSSPPDVEGVRQQLKDFGIDTKRWGMGEAKTLPEFAAEVKNGTANLMLDATTCKKLVRVVDVVLLRLSHTDSNGKTRFLTESSETYPDGRTRQELNRLPGTKKEPYENRMRVALRILSDSVGIGVKFVEFSSSHEVFEAEEESRSYPGVKTVYRKEIIEGVVDPDGDDLNRIGLGKGGRSFTHKDPQKNTKMFVWLAEEECQAKTIRLRAPQVGVEVSGLVQAPIGFREEELTKYLEDNSVDVSKFAEEGPCSLQAFSNELASGESKLVIRGGKATRVVDVVLLRLKKQSGEILTEEAESKDGGKTFATLNRLPGAKHRSDENQFSAAQRIIKKQLKLDENYVNLDETSVKIVEVEQDSTNFPGLMTLYRKCIISGTLLDPDEAQRLR